MAFLQNEATRAARPVCMAAKLVEMKAVPIWGFIGLCSRPQMLYGKAPLSVDDLEGFYLADAAMERVRKGQGSVLSSGEVSRFMGLHE